MAKEGSEVCQHRLHTPIYSLAIETMGVIGPKSLVFLKDLGRRLRQETKEEMAQAYLLQRLSIAVQRGNAVSVMGCVRVCILVHIQMNIQLGNILFWSHDGSNNKLF